MERKKTETKVRETSKIVRTKIKTRGKTFEGTVIKKFQKRVVIEFQRMVYVRKYERYSKTRTKLHARLPEGMEKEINIGDLIKVQECRPLSKIIHFMVIEKIKSGDKK
ncbi:MAG: 30S ribosomal protein S17 [Nanoarchaeota archaeon]|nr:30S ribosomal protein S17 [Nanoarchaeota archaeon]MBU4308419.1 30S ribosomal protein S17 [Nanoarchaeota archaeon]